MSSANTPTLSDDRYLGINPEQRKIARQLYDNVINLLFPDWQSQIHALSTISGVECRNYLGFIKTLEERRTFFNHFVTVLPLASWPVCL